MTAKGRNSKNSNSDSFWGGVLIGAGIGVLAAAIHNHSIGYNNDYPVTSLNVPEYGPDADVINLRRDWTMVGQDIRFSIDKIVSLDDLNDSGEI